MDITDTEYYNYDLPKSSIALEPRRNRSDSKLMYIRSAAIKHKHFLDLEHILNPGDLLILNDTRVIPARLLLEKETGGKVEILFNKIIKENIFESIYKSSRKPTKSSILNFKKQFFFKVKDIFMNKLVLENKISKDILKILEEYGEIPLPKYIKRPVTKNDAEMYQTVFAKNNGSVAAPTAGLHFTDSLIKKLESKGICIDYITLNISYNTFKPIETDKICQHNIGSEKFFIKKNVIENITDTKKRKKRVVAVGTTVTRVLEHCFTQKITYDYEGDANLFITPGYEFKVIDGLITNFHLPKSSLLLLVSAYVDFKILMKYYSLAIDNNYKFYSYGDSMFIDKK